MSLIIVPVSLAEANEFVRVHHRHHKPVPGAKFSIAVAESEKIVGVAIVGRPVSRMLDDGWTLEVNRVATDGTRNACSKLYGACRKAAATLGYKKIVTYILSEEPGSSLKGAGWRCAGLCGGGEWSCKSRPRVDLHPLQQKLRFEVEL